MYFGLFENKTYFENEAKSKLAAIAHNKQATLIVEDGENESIHTLNREDMQISNIRPLKANAQDTKNPSRRLSFKTHAQVSKGAFKIKSWPTTEFDKKVMTFLNGFLVAQSVGLLISHAHILIDGQEGFCYKLLLCLLMVGLVYFIFMLKSIWKNKANFSARWNKLATLTVAFHFLHWSLIMSFVAIFLFSTLSKTNANVYEDSMRALSICLNFSVYLVVHLIDLILFSLSWMNDVKRARAHKQARNTYANVRRIVQEPTSNEKEEEVMEIDGISL